MYIWPDVCGGGKSLSLSGNGRKKFVIGAPGFTWPHVCVCVWTAGLFDSLSCVLHTHMLEWEFAVRHKDIGQLEGHKEIRAALPTSSSASYFLVACVNFIAAHSFSFSLFLHTHLETPLSLSPHTHTHANLYKTHARAKWRGAKGLPRLRTDEKKCWPLPLCFL